MINRPIVVCVGVWVDQNTTSMLSLYISCHDNSAHMS